MSVAKMYSPIASTPPKLRLLPVDQPVAIRCCQVSEVVVIERTGLKVPLKNAMLELGSSVRPRTCSSGAPLDHGTCTSGASCTPSRAISVKLESPVIHTAEPGETAFSEV